MASRITAQGIEAKLTPRVAVAYDALRLPDNGNPELRRMGERTLLAVSLLLYARMQLARAVTPPQVR